MLDQIISYSFYLLFLLVPLFWTSLNYELFEYNKMMLTYGFTVIIAGAWLLKSINDKRLTIKRTLLDIPLLLFLGANILSTIFSMDVHTSIWGYYSRSNGGLLSLVSYLLLYWAFVSNMDKEKVLKTLKFGLLSGLIISIWGILEHFGVSLSCMILRGEFNDSCWVQDVQARVFASLGQPNWMAVYLAMLIFPVLYFFLTAQTAKQKVYYYLMALVYYLGFTFTYSRGPTLGLIAGFLVFIGLQFLRLHPKGVKLNNTKVKPILIVLLGFLGINILFGSALTSFRLVSKFAPPPRPSISLPASSASQLETGGTESGQIRLIVWKGALDIFKHYPIFGSGLETFAYSYYQFRPQSHNLTSEWDFLYNKAHNEYLNYLATTGIVGTGTYLLIIGTFLVWSIKKILKSKFQISNHLPLGILVLALLAGYISYLIYNFFLFSVVIIAIFFYLFPALAFVSTESVSSLQLSVFRWIYHRPLYTKAVKAVLLFAIFYLLFSIFKLWYADSLFAQGEKQSEAGDVGKAYNLISEAVALNSGEPFYRSELAYGAAQSATALKETDATLSASLKNEATTQMAAVLHQSPNNVSYWRAAVRTYFELSTIDKSYTQKTLDALDKAISLAPTDPKLYYNKALVLDSVGKKDEELRLLQKALELKPDYQEPKDQMKEATAPANKVSK